jgi:hypothetical protein
MALSTAKQHFSGDPRRILKQTDDCIEFELEPITAEDVAQFRRATWSAPLGTVPLTFATRFRWGEFRWLTRLGIEMQHLLHAEQEYRWDRSLAVGDAPRVRTWLAESRERRGMRFVVFETAVETEDGPIGGSRTLFVVRSPSEGAPQ